MMQRSFLSRMVKPTGSLRAFSTAGSIQARFEEAYQARTASLKSKVVKK